MRFFITDVFGNDKYSGNQLATFFDFGTLSTEEMQKITREINFSETTFITSTEKINDGYNVRIFTPGSEIDFAGHPSLSDPIRPNPILSIWTPFWTPLPSRVFVVHTICGPRSICMAPSKHPRLDGANDFQSTEN